MRLLLALSTIGPLSFFSAAGSVAAEAKYLRYEEFIAAVESGQVKEVQLDQYSKISGVQKGGDKEEKFESYAGGIGTVNDPLLLRLLEKYEVKVLVAPREEHGFWYAGGIGGMFMGIVMILLPILTFVYVVVTYRRVKSVAKSLSGSEKM